MARLRRAGAEEGLSTRQRILCPDRSVGWESGGGGKTNPWRKKNAKWKNAKSQNEPGTDFRLDNYCTSTIYLK